MSSENAMPLLLANPWISLNPTPHPDKSPYGYVSSVRLALRIATALGNCWSGTWWSHMMKSMPFSLAYLTSSIALIPHIESKFWV